MQGNQGLPVGAFLRVGFFLFLRGCVTASGPSESGIFRAKCDARAGDNQLIVERTLDSPSCRCGAARAAHVSLFGLSILARHPRAASARRVAGRHCSAHLTRAIGFLDFSRSLSIAWEAARSDGAGCRPRGRVGLGGGPALFGRCDHWFLEPRRAAANVSRRANALQPS